MDLGSLRTFYQTSTCASLKIQVPSSYRLEGELPSTSLPPVSILSDRSLRSPRYREIIWKSHGPAVCSARKPILRATRTRGSN